MDFEEVEYGDERSVRLRECPAVYREEGLYVTGLAGVLWVDEKQLPK